MPPTPQPDGGSCTSSETRSGSGTPSGKRTRIRTARSLLASRIYTESGSSSTTSPTRGSLCSRSTTSHEIVLASGVGKLVPSSMLRRAIEIDQARAVMRQDLEVGAPLRQEGEQVAGVKIEAGRLLHPAGETIEATAHVDRLRGQEDLLGGPGAQHGDSSRTTAANQPAGGGASKRRTCPPTRTETIGEGGVAAGTATCTNPGSAVGAGRCRATQAPKVVGLMPCWRANAAIEVSVPRHSATRRCCTCGSRPHSPLRRLSLACC